MELYIEELAYNRELDPFDVFSMYKDEKYSVILDSGMDPACLGRYSYIGVHPFKTITGDLSHYCINDLQYEGDVLTALALLLKQYKVHNSTNLPFIGGCIGYCSYNLMYQLEQMDGISKDDMNLPHTYFVFYDNLIIFDNLLQKLYVTSLGQLQNHEESVRDIKLQIFKCKKVEYHPIAEREHNFLSNFSKEDYLNAVSRVRDFIKRGDIYIANLTQRFKTITTKESYNIYQDLRRSNPSPFAVFMKFGEFDIISSSPERFLKITGRLIETRPIKGTRPRGTGMAEDQRNRAELENSGKDRSELLMIVDLERNDLSKICKPHTVSVDELFKIEEYSTVFHLVATVRGELKEGVGAVDCIKECFPGGSITGTPKIRAMEIIDELEGIQRSLYTGCIGYFSVDGNADFNIAIRTIIKKGQEVTFGVGGGITWESDNEAEYQETLDKAKALMRVV